MGDIWTVNLYNLCRTLLLVVYSPFQANVLGSLIFKKGGGWIIGLKWVKLTERVNSVEIIRHLKGYTTLPSVL